MVDRVLDLQDLTVRRSPFQWTRIGVQNPAPMRELLELCRQQPVNRLPVWEANGPGRRTVGIVSFSTLLYAPKWSWTNR